MSKKQISSAFTIVFVASFLTAILAASPILAQSDCCVGHTGDANGVGGDEPTLGDVMQIIEYSMILTIVPLPPPCFAEWDVNQSGGLDPGWGDITIGDISILIDYLFISGPSIGLPYCLGHSGGPYGYLHNMTDCKEWQDNTSGGTTCIEYEYDGQGILSMTHSDAALNCCPKPSLTNSVLGDTLFVHEADSGLCDCYCLYDIDYKVANLPVGNYRIVVLEAVSGGGGPLDFWADLAQSPTGTFCQERTQYPWGSEPTGAVVGRSECLSHGDGTAAASLSPDQSCVDVRYDGAGTLSLTHGNAGFNCCPESLSAQFSFDGSTITVTESETFGEWGGCLCLCLYDIEMRISNLPPGQYRIVFVEPYRNESEPALDITIDLRHAAATIHCVERNDYPWGIYEMGSGER